MPMYVNKALYEVRHWIIAGKINNVFVLAFMFVFVFVCVFVLLFVLVFVF